MKVSKVPGIENICKKRELSFAGNLISSIYKEKNWYFPQTFLLPEEFDAYHQAHSENKNRIFIAKVSVSSQGVGIRIVTSPSDLLISNQVKTIDSAIVQRYIENPLLLGGLKHDLRLYLLIANADPLIAFINEEGLARFCTETYSIPATNSKYDVKAHLTNYSINKQSKGYVLTEELLEPNDGTKRTLSSYWKTVKQSGFDPEKIKAEIKALCQHTLKYINPHLLYSQACKLKSTAKGLRMMHILGVDVMIDSNGKPWLLEANSLPSMAIEFVPEQAHSKSGPPESKTKTNGEPETPPQISAVDFYVKTQ